MFINEQDRAGALQTSTFWKVKLKQAKNPFRTPTNCLAVFLLLFYDNYFYLRLFIAIAKEEKTARGFHTELFLSFCFFLAANLLAKCCNLLLVFCGSAVEVLTSHWHRGRHFVHGSAFIWVLFSFLGTFTKCVYVITHVRSKMTHNLLHDKVLCTVDL